MLKNIFHHPLAGVLLLFTSQAAADQNAPELTDLFTALRQSGNQEQALELQDQIWAHWYRYADKDIETQMSAAHEAMSTGETELAMDRINEVITRASEFAEAWNLRATLYYQMQEYELSLRDIEQTLALEPRHFGALGGRGLCYLELDDKTKALEAFDAALRLHPWMPTAKIYGDQLKRELKQLPDGTLDM